jgi:hypothetical protein
VHSHPKLTRTWPVTRTAYISGSQPRTMRSISRAAVHELHHRIRTMAHQSLACGDAAYPVEEPRLHERRLTAFDAMLSSERTTGRHDIEPIAMKPRQQPTIIRHYPLIMFICGLALNLLNRRTLREHGTAPAERLRQPRRRCEAGHCPRPSATVVICIGRAAPAQSSTVHRLS